MASVLSILKLLAKLILLIILSPAIAAWLLFRSLHYRIVFVRSMVQAGMPRKHTLKLAGEVRLSHLLSLGTKKNKAWEKIGDSSHVFNTPTGSPGPAGATRRA